jgi:hypothetical protein
MKKLTDAQKLSNKLKKKIDIILNRTNLKAFVLARVLGHKSKNSFKNMASKGEISQKHYDKIEIYFKAYEAAVLEMENKLKDNDILVVRMD